MKTPSAPMKSILLIIAILSFFSCKKDPIKETNPIEGIYGINFKKTSFERSSNFSVYTHGKLITDATIHNQFKATDSFLMGHFLENLLFSLEVTNVKLVNANEAYVDHQYEIDTCDISLDGNMVILTDRTTLSSINSEDPYTYTPNYYTGKYKPPIPDEWLISSTRGQYIFGYLIRRQNIFEYIGGRLETPYIAFRQYRNGSLFRSFNMNNTLKTDFFHSIPPGDTLSILLGKFVYLRD